MAKLELLLYLWNGSSTWNEVAYETDNFCITSSLDFQHIVVTVTGSDGSLGTTLTPTAYVNGTAQALSKTAGTVHDYYAEHDRLIWNNVGGRLKAWNGSSGLYLGPFRSIMMIGGTSGQQNGRIYSGSLDETSLWSRGLTAAHVSEIYNGGVPCDLTSSAVYNSGSSNLVGWWRMGDAADGANTDAIASSNIGHYSASVNSIINVANASQLISLTPLATKGGTNNATIHTANVVDGCDPTAVTNEVTTYECRQIYDNLNLHHQIPRSDRQYSWIAHSITHTGTCEPRYSGFMQVNSPVAPYYEVTGNYYPFFDYVSASATTSGIFQNTTRLDLLITDKTGSAINTLGEATIGGGFK